MDSYTPIIHKVMGAGKKGHKGIKMMGNVNHPHHPLGSTNETIKSMDYC